jgi:branched-chain amino acid aminotransferase
MDKRPQLLMVDGKLVPYESATVHVLSTAFKYGTIVFEGLRAYWSEGRGELYIFRTDDHFRRLFESAAPMGIAIPGDISVLREQLLTLIRANELREDLHLRVQAFVTEDDGRMASVKPVSVTMAALPMGRYFGKEGLSVGVSSWIRISEQSMPPRIKAVPNYHNSRLAVLEAKRCGYDDAILLNQFGKVTEGPGYNIFVVRRGVLCTPPVTDSILEGITRDSVIRIARDSFKMEVRERSIDRSELYSADEIFFCGSAAELTPICSVDGISVADGRPGSLTIALRARYHDIASGDTEDPYSWTTGVYKVPVPTA